MAIGVAVAVLTLGSALALVQAATGPVAPATAPVTTPVTAPVTPSGAVATANAPLLVALVARGDGALCLPDGGLCFALNDVAADGSVDIPRTLVVSAGATPGLTLSAGGPPDPGAALEPIALPYRTGERETVHLWASAIALPTSDDPMAGREWLIGIITATSAMYSGGGGEGSRLHLHRFAIAPHAVALGPEILNLPWASSLMIRACFGENDAQRRRGACHDEYNFGGTLVIAPDNDRADDLPQLLYRTQATAYPQTARRGEDSSAAPPLTPADLSHWRDPECSYTRTLRYNAATLRYEMDRAGPDCALYTEP